MGLIDKAGLIQISAQAISWFANLLGFNQKRCRNCFMPFTAVNPLLELCPACQKDFRPYSGPACPICGEPGMPIRCQNCAHGRPWAAYAYHGLYEGPLREMILRLKYNGEVSLARYLATLLLEASICLPKPDVIVPIPQYPPYLSKRGFNQAHELGRHLAKMSGIKLDFTLLQRIRHNRAQASLNKIERIRNVADNFVATEQAAGKSIWLVDDVMTTGSTFEVACKTLLERGCKQISLLFVARTPLWHG